MTLPWISRMFNTIIKIAFIDNSEFFRNFKPDFEEKIQDCNIIKFINDYLNQHFDVLTEDHLFIVALCDAIELNLESEEEIND